MVLGEKHGTNYLPCTKDLSMREVYGLDPAMAK